MVTIFDGIEKMTKEQLCFEVALLEHVTVAEYARAAVKKAKRTSVRLANKVTSLVGKKQFDEPRTLTLSEQIAISAESLSMKSTEELRRLFKENLCRRLVSLGVQDADKLPKERLSVLCIEKAGEAIPEIPDATMVLRKAELIADKNTRWEPADFEDTVLENRLDREVLAHAVAAAVRAYDAKLAPVYRSLPSFLAGEALDAFRKEDTCIREAAAGRERFESTRISLEHEMKRSMDKTEVQKSTYRSLSEKEAVMLEKKAGADGAAAEPVGREDGGGEDSYESVLAETRKLMEECGRRQRELEAEYEEKKAQLALLLQQNDEAEKKLRDLICARAGALAGKWQAAYASCDFRDGVLSDVAGKFVYEELIALEEALAELCLSQNAENLDEPATKDKSYCSCTFYADTGYAGRIAYLVRDGRILILQIQKSRGKKAAQ